MDSVHPAFVQTDLAERLVLDGYDRVAVAHHITETMLRDEFDVRPGHAKILVSAAVAVQRAPGYSSAAAAAMVAPMPPPSDVKRKVVPLGAEGAARGKYAGLWRGGAWHGGVSTPLDDAAHLVGALKLGRGGSHSN